MQQLVFRSFFIAYLSGLIQLTLMFDIVRAFYSGILVRNRFFSSWYFFQFLEDHPFFSGEYCIKPQFYISSEKIGNLIMYMPFSILLCLAYNNVTFIKTIASGMSLVVTIELLQPIFGRQGDVTDIIINSIGIITSAVIFFVLNAVLDKWLIQKK